MRTHVASLPGEEPINIKPTRTACAHRPLDVALAAFTNRVRPPFDEEFRRFFDASVQRTGGILVQREQPLRGVSTLPIPLDRRSKLPPLGVP